MPPATPTEPADEPGCGHAHATDAAVVQPAATRTLGRRIALAPVFAYQRFLSPLLGPRCRYEPSCSHYAVQAVDRFGILRGLVLAVWRVARCQPLGGHGIDRPEDQRIFPLTARFKRAPHT